LKPTTAKHKLNTVYFIGIALIAAFVGLVTQSPTICIITAGVLVGALLHDGTLRL